MENDRRFEFEGAYYSISMHPFVHDRSNDDNVHYGFYVYIASYWIGLFVLDQHGYWLPLDMQINYNNLPFPLQAHDFQVIGEIIETDFKEFVIQR